MRSHEDDNAERVCIRALVFRGPRHGERKWRAGYEGQHLNILCQAALWAVLAFGAIGFAAPAPDLSLTFEGYLGNTSNLFFRVRSKRADGTAVDTWNRVGESVAGFQLIRFNGKTQALVVRDATGKERELVLPEGRVLRDVRLGDEEFKVLRRYLENPQEPNLPILSREIARAFWLRMNEELIEKFGPLPPGVILGFDRSGLPEEGKIRYDNAEKVCAERGQRIFVTRNADRFGIASAPLNAFQLPEPFTRNLTPDDWDELVTVSLLAIAGDFWNKGNMYSIKDGSTQRGDGKPGNLGW
jgi:hypothetical protein